jgi:mannose-6-phosphate isomerase-like protein (cupin superfamily)
LNVRSRELAEPFIGGSTIRLLLDAELGHALKQSLATATPEPAQATERGYPREMYVVLAGVGDMEIDGDRSTVRPRESVLIPSAWRQIRTETEELRFLRRRARLDRHEDTFFEAS